MTEQAPIDEPDEAASDHGLLVWERIVAGMVGLLAASGGGVSVFMSSNQAGSTALLLVGAIFLLLAVQGTAIRRATRESVEMDPRAARKRVIEKAQEVLEEHGIEKAEAFVDGATTRDPSLIGDERVVNFNGQLFEENVFAQINTLDLSGYGLQYKLIVSREVRVQSYRFDAVIKRADREDAWIVAEAIYTSRPFVSNNKLRLTIARMQDVRRPGLIISNRRMSKLGLNVWDQINQDPPVHFVLWRASDDNLALLTGITKLMAYYD
jgi:nucleotide-binding universal stress UspA family protein